MKKRSLFLLMIFSSFSLYAQQIESKDLKEISGLVISSKNKGIVWVHNDSGDKGNVYALNLDGTLKATFNYKDEVIDCEDIALAPDSNGLPSIYVGDIGDNNAQRPFVSIYKFHEPILTQTESSEIENFEILNVQYPDGSRDAECLLVDNKDQKIYIITKREDSVGVYSTPLKFKNNETIILKKEGSILFKGFKNLKYITAGDISQDGKQVLIKSYMNVFYWERKDNESLFSCLQSEPKIVGYKPERQGEAIGFSPDSKFFYTISEGESADIIKYVIK